MAISQVDLSTTELDALRGQLRGDVITPGDGAYDEARKVWNGSIDRRPALIARCTGVADVRAALRFARDEGLLIAVRGGGHNVAGSGTCDGGIVLDLGPMKGIRVDPERRTIRVGPGVLWGEFDHETQAFGLAAPGGVVTHTGVAGLTLGGGIGWLMGKHGLTIDNLLSVDVLTADGELLQANENENADLFWAVRGGGGNFGIVTSFEFALHPVGPTVLAGPVFFPMRDAPEVLRFYREWRAEAPHDLTTIVSLRKCPALPVIPEHLHGELVVGVMACYAGDVEEGERIVRPLKRFGSPVLDLLVPKPYRAHQSMFDPGVPHGWNYYWKSCDVPSFTDDVIDTLTEHSLRISSPRSYTIIFDVGGAVTALGEDDTAFHGRTPRLTVNVNGVVDDSGVGFDEETTWARGLWTALRPHHLPSVYVNFLSEEGEDRTRSAYGEAKFARLRAVKAKYDPDNTFRVNQNIPPG